MSILSNAEVIRDETVLGANTATRVGGNLVEIANDLTTKQSAIDLNDVKVSFDSTASARLAGTSGTNTGDQNLSGLAPINNPTFTGTVAGITKTMVGLGSVDNTTDATKPISTAQQAALNLKANLASPTFTGTVSGITKTMVGLSNVPNTDFTTPISDNTAAIVTAVKVLAISPVQVTGAWFGTQAQYTALGSYSATVTYNIT